MEQILVKTNPVASDLYLGTIETSTSPQSRGSEPSAYSNAQIKAYGALAVLDHCNLVYLRSLSC
jgi:hypothetical protein